MPKRITNAKVPDLFFVTPSVSFCILTQTVFYRSLLVCISSSVSVAFPIYRPSTVLSNKIASISVGPLLPPDLFSFR